MSTQEISALHDEYASLEGSALTDIETQILLDDGITAKGKLLEHHLMVKDNYEAIVFSLSQAGSRYAQWLLVFHEKYKRIIRKTTSEC